MGKSQHHVVPGQKRGPDVKKPGSSKASSHHRTQSGAVMFLPLKDIPTPPSD